MRAHNLLYALGGALAVPTVPTASRYVATGDDRRLRELAVRGSRYTLALFVPLCVTLMVMSKPIIGVWLGDRYADGAAALSILVSYWLVYGALIVTPGFLVGAGAARTAGRTLACAAAINLVLALILTPKLGVEGPAVATAGAVRRGAARCCSGPACARRARSLERARSRRAMAPAYALGAVLAGALAAIRFGLEPGDARAGRGRRDRRRARLLGRVLRARARPGRARAGARPAAALSARAARAAREQRRRRSRSETASSNVRPANPDLGVVEAEARLARRRRSRPSTGRPRRRPRTARRSRARTVRAVELVVVLVAQLESLPAPERRASPGRMSTSTSRIAPRAHRTSFAMPGWKCIPRSTPWRRARVVVLDELVA